MIASKERHGVASTFGNVVHYLREAVRAREEGVCSRYAVDSSAGIAPHLAGADRGKRAGADRPSDRCADLISLLTEESRMAAGYLERAMQSAHDEAIKQVRDLRDGHW